MVAEWEGESGKDSRDNYQLPLVSPMAERACKEARAQREGEDSTHATFFWVGLPLGSKDCPPKRVANWAISVSSWSSCWPTAGLRASRSPPETPYTSSTSVPAPTAFAYISTNTAVKLWAIVGLVGRVVIEYGLLWGG